MPNSDVPAAGRPCPDFSLPDLDGRIWRRKDLLRAPAVLFCFSSW